MGIKYSTGRGTRVRHSTALEWEDLEKAKKKYDPIKHATGEEASIRHATGTEFDYKYLYKMMAGNKDSKPVSLVVRSKPKDEADEVLEKFYQAKKIEHGQKMRGE